MRKNRLGINTLFGLSYFIISFFSSLISDPLRNDGQLYTISSEKGVKFSLGGNPIGQVNPTGDNSAYEGSLVNAPFSPITTKGTATSSRTNSSKLPIQDTFTASPSYPENGVSSIGSSDSFTDNFSCPTPVIQDHTIYVCSGVPIRYDVPNGVNNYIVPAGTDYIWNVIEYKNEVEGESLQNLYQQYFTGTTLTALINKTTVQQEITYNVTPRSGGCTGQAFRLTVVIDPSPKIAAKTISICSGETFTVTPTNTGSDIVPDNTT